MLELKNVNYSYGEFSLKDINVTAKEGEVVSLLGPSGCGKSTLLRNNNGIRRGMQR